jgi:hypothetical protein
MADLRSTLFVGTLAFLGAGACDGRPAVAEADPPRAASAAAPKKPAVAAAAPQASAPTDLAARVEQFYVWYLRQGAQDPEFPFSDQAQRKLAPYLTPDFLRRYRTPAPEADPFLCAQDTYDEWAAGRLSARTTAPAAGSSSAVVTFGPPPEPAHRIQTRWKQIGQTWRLDAVSCLEAGA